VVEAKKSFEVGIAFGHDLTCLLVPTSQIRTDPSQLDETFNDAEISITPINIWFFYQKLSFGIKSHGQDGCRMSSDLGIFVALSFSYMDNKITENKPLSHIRLEFLRKLFTIHLMLAIFHLRRWTSR